MADPFDDPSVEPTTVGIDNIASAKNASLSFDPSWFSKPIFGSHSISPPVNEESKRNRLQSMYHAPLGDRIMGLPEIQRSLENSQEGFEKIVGPLGVAMLTESCSSTDSSRLKDRPLAQLNDLVSHGAVHLVDTSTRIDYKRRSGELVEQLDALQNESPQSLEVPTELTEEEAAAALAFPPLPDNPSGTMKSAGMVNSEANAKTRRLKILEELLSRFLAVMQARDRTEDEGEGPSLADLQEEAAAAVTKIVNGERLEPFAYNELLCSRCRSLGLTPELFVPRGPFKAPLKREGCRVLVQFPFDTLDPLSTCPLCQLMRRGLERLDYKKMFKSKATICTLYLGYYSFYWDNKASFQSFRFLDLHAKTVEAGKGAQFNVHLLPVENDNYPLAFVGRSVQQFRTPAMLIKRWLQQCEQVHGPMCAHGDYYINHFDRNKPPAYQAPQSRLMDILEVVLFIDAERNCLVSLDRPERYLALSYVWGNAKFSHTVEENVQSRKQPGALKNEALPKVIADAITLTRDIGERYLWVDSLCIIQNNARVKAKTISKMDVIYGDALVTIIAAGSDSADEGLPCVSSSPRNIRQLSADVGNGLRFIVPHNLASLDRTTWASRAWTYQEYCLSKRKLIFVNGQVTFSCAWDSPFREDVLSELQIFGMEDYGYKLPASKLDRLSRERKPPKALHWNHLGEFIQSYSSRNLTYPNDIQNAFAGIEAMVKTNWEFELAFGLLKPAMTLSLLWSSGFLKRREGFPSWSWMGWIGDVVLPTDWVQAAEWTGQYSWIDWYLYNPIKEGFSLLEQNIGKEIAVNSAFVQLLTKYKQDSGPSEEASRSASSSTSNPNLPDSNDRMAALNINQIKGLAEVLRNTGSNEKGEHARHTLRFCSFARRVLMSVFDPWGNMKRPPVVHLYDERFQYIGIAYITDFTIWAQAGLFSQKESPGDPTLLNFPIDIVLLSGPELPTIATKSMYVWSNLEEMNAMADTKYYRVLLLSRFGALDYKPLPTGVFERAGTGEVREDLVGEWESLEWREISLQ